ncbi:hypothetical protein ACFLRF_03065 [Candidatus Altiarchaeota archaeon]
MAEDQVVRKTFNEDLDVNSRVAEGGILARLYLEVQGNDKDAAKNALDGTVFGKMNAEPMAKLLEVSLYDIQKSEDNQFFSGVAEVKLIADDFRGFVNIAMRYGPTGIEIIKPETVKLDSDDMHALAGDVSSMMQLFSNQIISMLNDPERAALYQQMLAKTKE